MKLFVTTSAERAIKSDFRKRAEAAFDAMMNELPPLRASWAALSDDIYTAQREIWIHGYTKCLARILQGQEKP